MIQIVKKQKPNSIKIKKLRERLNLSQEEFLAKMKEDLGYTMSRRTYQRIEKGDDVQPKYLDFIIKFYDKKNIKINMDELISGINKRLSKLGYRSSSKKTIQTYEYQKAYLYNVNNFDDVSKLIAKSSRRKFFYPLTIRNTPPTEFDTKTEKEMIRKIITKIDEYGKKNFNTNNQISREKYDNVNLEFDLIDIVTDFGESLKFINSEGINLYAANFNLPQLSVEAIDPHPYNDIYKYGVHDKLITIFCFKRDKEEDLNFNYENYWHKEKLKQILKKHKMDNFQKDQFEWQDPETNDEILAFEQSIKYFEGIDASKVTFDHRVPFTNDDYEPDGRDLDELMNIYDEERAMSKHEADAAQDVYDEDDKEF